MRESNLSLPELFLIAGTRVALGVGIGMLVSGRMNDDRRKGAGTALVAVGAITTIPLLMMVFGKNRNKNSEFLAAS
jgi:hypothetical protein